MGTRTWEQEPEFKGWLKSSKKGSNFAFCKACNKDFICGKSEIQKHYLGKLHIKLVKSLKTQKTLTDMSTYVEKNPLAKKIKTAEIRIAAYAVEHNILFSSLDHLSEIIRTSFTDPEVAKNFTCSRTKVAAIVSNVLGQYSFETSIELLRSKKFSLIVDESTDKGSIKHLALVARIFHVNKIIDLFFGLRAIANATADELYNTI
uniref:Uncharacterized protein LOC114348295 n=1 Tax=Diabrotica virgifera virgifera TaxID=50390 RepID=A0A6P7GZ46_DIAVI